MVFLLSAAELQRLEIGALWPSSPGPERAGAGLAGGARDLRSVLRSRRRRLLASVAAHPAALFLFRRLNQKRLARSSVICKARNCAMIFARCSEHRIVTSSPGVLTSGRIFLSVSARV